MRDAPSNDNQRAGDRGSAAQTDGSLALMITRRQRARLLDLGVTEAELHVMSPTEAHRILHDRGDAPR